MFVPNTYFYYIVHAICKSIFCHLLEIELEERVCYTECTILRIISFCEVTLRWNCH